MRGRFAYEIAAQMSEGNVIKVGSNYRKEELGAATTSYEINDKKQRIQIRVQISTPVRCQRR